MASYIVLYRNDYDEDVIQSVHDEPQEAIDSLPRHLAAWGWDSRGLKHFHIEIWGNEGYVNDLPIPAKI